MNNDHNPPAFPISVPGHLYGDGSSELPYVAQEGMTLRDYLAAKALAAMITANESGPGDFRYNDGSKNKPEMHRFCETAYAMADMMLETRNGVNPTPQRTEHDENCANALEDIRNYIMQVRPTQNAISDIHEILKGYGFAV